VPPAGQCTGKSLDADGITAKAEWRVEGGQHAKSQAAQNKSLKIYQYWSIYPWGCQPVSGWQPFLRVNPDFALLKLAFAMVDGCGE
jgi:hypothetical protein